MARLLRPNIHLQGVDTAGSDAYGLGRSHPHGSEAGLIIPQVIEWPWSEDDAGCTFPAGLYGVRSVCDTREVERAWLTAGDATEGEDRWIAVPDTLPGDYTARNARDHNKGHYAPAVFGIGGGTRGTPYFDLRHNGLGVSAGAGNYTATAGAYLMTADYTINNQDLTDTGDHMPSYRPSGGGGIVKLAWFPTALSDRTLKCIFYDNGHPVGLPGGSGYDAWIIANTSGNLGISLFTKPSPGFRRIKWRAVVAATDAQWAGMAENELRVQFRIAHNADNSTTGIGDTNDYLSPVFTKSDYTKGSLWSGSSYYYTCEHSATDADYTLPDPGDEFRRWYVGYLQGHWPLQVTQAVYPTTEALGRMVWLSPRVDIPFWFTATSGNLVAPGGLPT